jgi:alpha-1,3-mannosyltransferase
MGDQLIAIFRQFLSEETFTSKPLSVLLLALHVTVLLYLFVYRVSSSSRSSIFRGQGLHPFYITRTLFISNFVGICFARTLHYQFYAWYFHSLPFLLWWSSSSSAARKWNLPIPLRLLCLAAMEWSFLTFPATPLSSAMLQLVHFLILGKCVWQMSDNNTTDDNKNDPVFLTDEKEYERPHKEHVQ